MRLAVLFALALPASSRAGALKTLTFNTAGIPLVHAHWASRRDAIAKKLKESAYDVVALQEVWRDKDARKLYEASGMPYYARHEDHALMGDGLEILSRFPILETRHLRFRCTPPGLWKLFQGETVANKGALMARLETPAGELDVYDTHLAADYPSDRYTAIRQAQLFELFDMIRSVSAGRPFLLLGDLNAGPQDPEYGQLKDLLGLADACLKDGAEVCGASTLQGSKRIDHILIPGGPASARLAFAEAGYSDHKAVEAEVDLDLRSLRFGPKTSAQIPVLRALRARFEETAASLSMRTRKRRWLPFYGFFHSLRYDQEFFNFESLAARVDSLLIGACKDCAQREPERGR